MYAAALIREISMKVGVNLANFGEAAEPDTLARWAKIVEALGYHHLMTSDHVTITPDVGERFPAPFYEPLTTLGWLAGVTLNISIGASVIILPYRSPLEIARAFANIDQFSGGRCILGVGVGWAKQEYAALNVAYEKRGALANEYLAVIRKMWTEEVSSFEGEFIRFTDVDSKPMPVQSPQGRRWQRCCAAPFRALWRCLASFPGDRRQSAGNDDPETTFHRGGRKKTNARRLSPYPTKDN